MKQEDKELLLKDLCARLPYGVKVEYLYWDEGKCEEYPVPMAVYSINADGYMELIGDVDEGGGHVEITKYLPYLRPMSSMTEEEENEYKQFLEDISGYAYSIDCVPQIDWLIKNHFDFRNLIERGLAIDCTDLNIY